MRYTKEQLENALKACIDLLKDLQEEGNDWLESEFDNLTAYHPPSRKSVASIINGISKTSVGKERSDTNETVRT